MRWLKMINWLRRHKGWRAMLILTLVALVWACVRYETADAFTVGRITGWVWFVYLVLWAIWGRKEGW